MMYRVAAKASISRHAMQTQKRNLSGTCRCVIHAITILTNSFNFEFKRRFQTQINEFGMENFLTRIRKNYNLFEDNEKNFNS